jgi:AcrR family transcriptional regulator
MSIDGVTRMPDITDPGSNPTKPPSTPQKASGIREVQPPDGMRRTPQQLRSRRMVNAIVEAAGQILRQQGREGLSTTSLEVISGVSKASLYQYFPNLDAVVAEVFHDVIRQRMTEWSNTYVTEFVRAVDVVTLVVDSVLLLHRELLELDREFYCSYSGYYDLWQAFDENQQCHNASMLFLKQSLEQCNDSPTESDIPITAYALGRSIELTAYAMLRDDPDFLAHPEFRNILTRIGCAIVQK